MQKLPHGRTGYYPGDENGELLIHHWHDKIKEATIADALLDRLLNNAQKINLEADSMRKLRSNLTKNRNSEK